MCIPATVCGGGAFAYISDPHGCDFGKSHGGLENPQDTEDGEGVILESGALPGDGVVCDHIPERGEEGVFEQGGGDRGVGLVEGFPGYVRHAV